MKRIQDIVCAKETGWVLASILFLCLIWVLGQWRYERSRIDVREQTIAELRRDLAEYEGLASGRQERDELRQELELLRRRYQTLQQAGAAASNKEASAGR